MVKKLDALSDDQLAASVMESANKIWMAGLGAFSAAQDEGTKTFDTLVEEGESIHARARKVAGDTLTEAREKASDAWSKLEEVFEDRIARALGSLSVPSKKEIGILSKRIAELVGKVGGASKAKPARATTRKAPAAKARTAKPAAAKPAAARRAAAKPAKVKRTAAKAVTKLAKKPATAKVAARKPAAAKAGARKPAAAKTAAPKRAAAKPVAAKRVSKKAAPVKAAAAKKAPAKKTPAVKAAAAKPAASKAKKANGMAAAKKPRARKV